MELIKVIELIKIIALTVIVTVSVGILLVMWCVFMLAAKLDQQDEDAGISRRS